MAEVKAMSPQAIGQATDKLIQAAQNTAVETGQDVARRQEALAPGLATGTNEQGGYNYQRVVAPDVEPLAASLNVNAKQNILKQMLGDAAYQANNRYAKAQSSLQQAQQDYQKASDLAYEARQLAAKKRREEAAARRQAYYNSMSSGGGGASGGYNAAGGGLNVVGLGASSSPKSGGGFSFTDSQGNAISAAKYAQLTGTPFRTVLKKMAASGDSGARKALGFVGNDFGYDPRDVDTQWEANLYNSLTWGVGGGASPWNPSGGGGGGSSSIIRRDNFSAPVYDALTFGM